MIKTVLVLGPAGAGKTSLIRMLADEHPDHHWHLVRLEPNEDGSPTQTLRVTTDDWAGLWHVRYGRQDILDALPEVVERITSESQRSQTVIAFESPPDALIRHAISFDMRVFVMPPIIDDGTVFRNVKESRHALQEILQDSLAFSVGTLTGESGIDDADPDGAGRAVASPAQSADDCELNEAQVRQFLACPLGNELAARVHLQPAFKGLADADLVVLNAAAGECLHESDTCWHRIQALLGKMGRQPPRQPLTYVCDLSDTSDPCVVRILRRMGDLLCRV